MRFWCQFVSSLSSLRFLRYHRLDQQFHFMGPEVGIYLEFFGFKRLDYNFTFRCPEVALGFSILGVQRLDSNLQS